MNPVLLARSINKIRAVGKEPTTTDEHVTRRHYLLIDCDAKRPAGISDSDDEHNQAKEKAVEIDSWLADEGWPAGMMADSGNGAHLLFRIDEPRDDNELVKRCLEALQKMFGDGAVSVDTVTAQILYEIGGPRYVNPDVVTRFDTIRLAPDGADRVRISGVRGEPAPAEAKVAINYIGGYRNEMTMVLTGLDIEAKAAFAERSLRHLWDDTPFAHLEFNLWRSDRPDPQRNEEACALLRVTVKDDDRERAGRLFSDESEEAILPVCGDHVGPRCSDPAIDVAPGGYRYGGRPGQRELG